MLHGTSRMNSAGRKCGKETGSRCVSVFLEMSKLLYKNQTKTFQGFFHAKDPSEEALHDRSKPGVTNLLNLKATSWVT